MTTKLDTLNIQPPQEIPGLIFRHFRGDEDYPSMLKTYKLSMEADKLEAAESLEDFINSFNFLTRCNPETDIVLVESDGENAGYGLCWWDQELDGSYRYSFRLHLRPEWRGKGIGRAVMEFLTNRMDEIATHHPAEANKYYQTFSAKSREWQVAILEDLGYKPIRYIFRMSRPGSLPVEVLPLPEGIEVRPIQPDQYRQVWDADHEAFRDHFGYSEPNEEQFQAWQKESIFMPELWKVAWDGDEIAGMVLNFIDKNENERYGRKRGYTEDISTRRPWRRQGIARALLSQSIQMFQEMGMDETALSVDAENPSGALKLYEDVGYKEYLRWIVYRKYMDGSQN
ncbi:MAG TPA: GNAT family N-acetyltransferase [Anaerolineales bacterium]|nr:GNAT family N-acetyltransferase [Anaerolineales bacterium]